MFCKDGEEVLSQTGSEEEVAYNYVHVVSRGSTGNYSCRYEIKDGNNQVTRSQLSPAQHLSITGSTSSSGGAEEPTPTGPRRAPHLYLSPTSARPGDSMRLQCSVFSQVLVTRIVFCKDGEEVSSQTVSEEKVIYSWNHTVSSGSSGNYSCGYETKDTDNRVSRSQLSPAKQFSVTGPAMSLAIWTTRCALVLLLLVSAPVITFMMEKRGLPILWSWRRLVVGAAAFCRRRQREIPTDQL
ncbi:hypothetical protein KIL84_001839 [Mauremys mutica]|uniref:Ig-like domain-containing protein n=1 Tax=Mauremys mutica TaxID=74926 RepID=A0A9D3XKT3_9SAUR|nr:hypothetical protein KIL84_001839 [Mauremys mutica]